MVKIHNNCINCGLCYSACPFDAIEEGGTEWQDNNKKKRKPLSMDHYFINPTKCKKCFRCVEICPIRNITKKDIDKTKNNECSQDDEGVYDEMEEMNEFMVVNNNTNSTCYEDEF